MASDSTRCMLNIKNGDKLLATVNEDLSTFKIKEYNNVLDTPSITVSSDFPDGFADVGAFSIRIKFSDNGADSLKDPEFEFDTGLGSSETYTKEIPSDWTTIYISITVVDPLDGICSITPVTYSINNPFYIKKTKIQITCSTPDSQIYYTSDNSEPNKQSNLYSDIFEVEEGTTIKAKAYKEGYIESDIHFLTI